MVLVIAPRRDQTAGMTQVGEQMLVEAFVPEAAIEALDKAVLHRFPGRDVVPFDPALLLPFEDGVAGQLGPIARREEALFSGYGRLRSPQIAQRVAITGPQVSTVVLHEPH